MQLRHPRVMVTPVPGPAAAPLPPAPAPAGPRRRERRPGAPVRMRVLSTGVGWSAADPGGLNRYVTEVHLALRRMGVDAVTVVLGGSRGGPAGMVMAGGGLLLPARLLRLWWAAQRQSAVDVVVSHFAPHALLASLLGRHAHVPLVVHFHGPWAGESRAMGEPRLITSVKHRVERMLYQRAAALIVLSQLFADLLVEDYGVPRDRILVVPPGVDTQRFSPVGEAERSQLKADLGVPVDRPLVVTVRRLVPRMGLDVLLDAWSELPTGSATLVVGGSGPLEQALRRRTADDPSVQVLGGVTDDELVRLYRAADLVVVPSLALEGFGLVVLEALACGTPVVASRLGGMGEVLPRLSPSLVVPPGDRAELATALARVLRDELPTRDRCRAFAELYSWDETAERLHQLYDDIAVTRRR